MRKLTVGLARPMLRLLGRDERGAFGVLIGVLIGGGVLLGMGALVIDVGMIYNERAQLQNGASAAALAVAKSCVNGACTASSIPQTAQTYADGNAKDNVSRVDRVCGSGDPNLAACLNPGTTAPITRCPPLPASGTNYVDVHTSTEQPGGSPFLPPFLARALLGNGSYQGTTVYACARAEWGPAETSDSLALTVSLCAWQNLTGGDDTDGDYEIGVDGDGDDGSYFDHLLPLWIKGKASACKLNSSGQNLPGGFGWLQPDCTSTGSTTCSDPCTAKIDINTSVSPPTGTTYTDPGANVTNDCKTALQSDLGTKVYIPVFDRYTSQGHSGTYHIIGLAGFFITGYANMTGIPDAGIKQTADPPGLDPTGYQLCVAPSSFSAGLGSSVFNQECIEGYFTKGLTNLPGPSSNTSNGPSFGVKTIHLTG